MPAKLKFRVPACAVLLLALLPALACAPTATPPPADDCCPITGEPLPKATATADYPADPPLVGGIAIPQGVRDNLGITFAKATRRAVANAVRLPGAFEWMPDARRDYRVPLGGRIEFHVAPLQHVKTGDLLFRIDSPEWRRLQHETVEADGEIKIAKAALDVARAQRNEADTAADRMAGRVANLADAGVRRADLDAELAALRNTRPRLDAEVKAREVAVAEAEEHFTSRKRALASITGLDPDILAAQWRAIDQLEIRAVRDGVVEHIAAGSGDWLETGDAAVTTADPTAIWFHADATAADLLRLHEGLPARVVPAEGLGLPVETALPATLHLGLAAHPETRLVSVYARPEQAAPWARAGIAALLEIDTESTEALAIPRAALMRDGLDVIFFRRNPKDPDRAGRVKADLGPDDGRWVVVRSGLKEGDEVVVEGAYGLLLADTGGQAPPGYHFHADGSLHKDH